MLKLTIKKGHAICIGDDVRIEFEPEHYKDKIHVKTKIFAPDEVPVKRLEIYENREEIEKDLNDYFKRVKKNKQKKQLLKGNNFKNSQIKSSSSPQFGTYRAKHTCLPVVDQINTSVESPVSENKKQPKIIFKKKRMYNPLKATKTVQPQFEVETTSN
ncbi:carbon storage regulator [Spartinivicinus poritis]|uniref:Carbon storage regulator n=1 Tax=Spartinivicinus poritis TaxID=2994640 RepID=A0ABT5U4E7_9GAMM|nr:carbon storage regulator [Spartinivicinus sp. A2-2]MDE1461240.1 carbon storage regulator [Spartinivicinus sp. A2-2]